VLALRVALGGALGAGSFGWLGLLTSLWAWSLSFVPIPGNRSIDRA